MNMFPSSYSRLSRLTILFLLILGFSSSVHATATSNGITGPSNAVFRAGMWHDQNSEGSGWEINQIGDTVYAFWYTFDNAGEPVWYYAQGQLEGTIFKAPLQVFSWDYGNNSIKAATLAGDLVINFQQPQLAEVDWSIGAKTGKRTLQPLISSTVPVLTDYSGFWFEPADPSYGISVQTQGDAVFAVMYYYDKSGKATWATGNKGRKKHILDMLTYTGTCPGCELNSLTSSAAGELLLYFVTETRMRVKITFPDAAPSWNRANAKNVRLSNSPSGRPHPAALANLASAEALKFYYRAGFLEQGDAYSNAQYCYSGPIVSPAPPVEPASSAILSGTNIQVVGVEEADVIKATTDSIYSIDFDMGEIHGLSEGDDLQQSITRYNISASGDLPSVAGKFIATLPRQLQGTSRYLSDQGLYHYLNEVSGKDQLTYIVTQAEGSCRMVSQTSTYLFHYRSGPETDYEMTHSLRIDGSLVASRRIGNRLFLAISYHPNLRALAADTYTEEEYQDLVFDQDLVRDLFERIEPSALLPKLHYQDGSEVPLVEANKIMMPPLPDNNLDPVLTSLVMLDMDDPSAVPVSLAIMGRIDGMYATPDNVYFTSSKADYQFNAGTFFRRVTVDTDIHKIMIKADALEYRGSGMVEGSLGYDPTSMAYRMSEHQDYLRVLSEDAWGNRWGEMGAYRLSTLAESASQRLLLESVSILPNKKRPQTIGKPGERLHSMRFYGERAYAVTFERIDPLYVFDLSNTADPKILGELEIEGFSDYLHPVGENLLIGVGMQAVNSTDPAGTWIQGVQVGLFDVSIPTSPKLLDTYVSGYRRSHTIVRNTPHAFTLLPADPESGRPLRFVIPLLENTPVDGVVQPDPGTNYPWKSTGVLMFEIEEHSQAPAELVLTAHAPIASRGEVAEDDEYFYQSWSGDSARSVIYADQVFHYYRGGVFSTPWAIDDFQMAVDCELCLPR